MEIGYDVVSVRGDIVGVRNSILSCSNDVVGVRNDVVSVCNIAMNVTDGCMSIYRKFGLKPDDQRCEQKSGTTHIEYVKNPVQL